MSNRDKTKNIDTLCVHAGVRPEPVTGAVMTPIFQTSTYAQEYPGRPKLYDYARGGNPTRTALEESLAALEGAHFGFAWPSGLAAVQAVVQLLDPGAHVLVSEDGYGGTGRLFRKLYSRYNLNFEFLDFRDGKDLEDKIKKETKLIWLESPTNPLLRMADITEISERAKRAGALLVVDNTFATPIFQRPLALGADIVMHSTTKYIGGHSDLIGGALMLNDANLAEKLKFLQFGSGSVNSPFESFLILRSIKTLALRMKKHEANALAVAEALVELPQFEEVIYPGLKTHPQFELARRQMSGSSGIITARLRGDAQAVAEFLTRLKVFTLAESFGGVESLVNHPQSMTHASVPEDLAKRLGITSDLVRFSIGIEDPRDLIDDIVQALV